MNVKTYHLKIGIIFFLIVCFSHTIKAQFKIVGYLPTWGDVNSVDYSKMTHVNVAFANPDWAGNLSVPNGLATVVQRAHATNTKVLISLGGANGDHATWHNVISDANRAMFVQKVYQYVINYNLDGVDVDLEGGAINADYTDFIVDLSARLKPANKLLTFAIATWQGGQITDRAIAAFDFVNIMSYDHTGPWTAGSPGQHSPYAKAVEEIAYWKGRGFAKEDVVLGVPFYGWRFNGGAVDALTFTQIANYPGAENVDEYNTGAGIVYYNGIPTIKRKTQLAEDQAGGIMIWQILGDASGSKSLLTAINEESKGGNNAPQVSITSPANNASFTAGATVNISANASDSDGSITSVEFFVNGQSIGSETTAPYTEAWIATAGTHTITVRARDNAGAVTTSSAVTITVNNVVTQGPYGGTARPIPGKIEAEHYDLGGQGVAFNDLTTANRGNAFRTEAVDVEDCSDSGNGYNIGYIQPGEWVEYTVNVTAGTYYLDARVAAMTAGINFHVELDGQNISGNINVPNTGGWQNWQTVRVTTPALTGGTKVLRIVMDEGEFNLNYISFTTVVNNNAPTVSITSPSENASFNAGSAITISANSNDSDGNIIQVEFLANGQRISIDNSAPYTASWTPSAAGTYTLTARATDNSGASTTSASISVSVIPVNNTPTVSITSPSNNASFNAGSAITISANANDSDGNITQVEFLANGQRISIDNSAPYTASWTPSAAGTYTLTARATDNDGATTTSAAINVTINTVSNQTPYGGTARTIPGRIEAEHYDLGGQGIAFNDFTAANRGNAFRSEAVDVEDCSDSGNGYNIGYVEAGEWVEYTVNVTAGTYRLDVRVAAITSGINFHIELDGQDISGSLTVPNTGDWQSWQTVTVTTPALTAGTKVLRVVMDEGEFNLNYINFASQVDPQSPYGGTARTIPGKIEAEHYDLGGQGIAYNDLTAANEGSAFRNDAVDVEPCSDEGLGYNIGYARAGEWVEYTVDVTAGTYRFDFRVAAITAGKTFHVEMDGKNISGAIAVPNTGAWQNWQTVSVNNITLAAGRKVMRVVMDDFDFNLNYINVVSQPMAKAAAIISNTGSFPNPTLDDANVTFKLEKSGTTTIIVYDEMGYVAMTVFEGHLETGYHEYKINTSDLGSGIYRCLIVSGGQKASVTILKTE